MTCTDPRVIALGLQAATQAKGRAEVTESHSWMNTDVLVCAPVTLMSHEAK